MSSSTGSRLSALDYCSLRFFLFVVRVVKIILKKVVHVLYVRVVLLNYDVGECVTFINSNLIPRQRMTQDCGAHVKCGIPSDKHF